MAKAEGRGIQSIEAGNRLLEILMRSPQPMMLKDLANEAGIAAAQAHAYLASFRRVELVEQDNATGRYVLGPATARLGMARIRTAEPLATASSEAPAIARLLELMVVVVVWGPESPSAAQVFNGGPNLNINLRAGTSFSVSASAGGRVFAAFSKSERVAGRLDAEFAGLRDRGVGGSRVTRKQLDAELSDIRRDGYAVLPNSPVAGLCSISVPVIANDDLALAITAIGRTDSLDLTPKSPVIGTLLQFAGKLADRVPAVRA